MAGSNFTSSKDMDNFLIVYSLENINSIQADSRPCSIFSIISLYDTKNVLKLFWNFYSEDIVISLLSDVQSFF